MNDGDIVEEESEGDHINHELFVRNGARGLTSDQISIVNETSHMGPKKPKQYLKAFRARAKDLLAIIFFYIQTFCIRSIII